jgi:hypothetical protein
MNSSRKPLVAGLTTGLLVVIFLAWPELTVLMKSANPAVVSGASCPPISSPTQMHSPALINFDTLANSAVIGSQYKPSLGVTFEDIKTTQAIIYGNEPLLAKSSPNVAVNNAAVGGTSAGVPMNIYFDQAKTEVGFWIGNGSNLQLTALVTAYDQTGAPVCQARYTNVPEAHTTFVGFSDANGGIIKVSVDYGATAVSESIDDLYFSPGQNIQPTRTPMPAWTPIPPARPTLGPTPTATPLVSMVAFLPIKAVFIAPKLFTPDYSIHGVEITQGIQCFDPTKGLDGTTCPDNSLPLVAKKDTTARVYLKANNAQSVTNNIPVRLYLHANNVWYHVDALGKTTTSINQLLNESANIWFNVNFSSLVVVDFYAVVDPDNLYTETNESNNRYPLTSGTYLTLTFQPRKTFNVVGERLYYHPDGYSGSQYAGGWAVNGGAADWFEQILPVPNNGVSYSVKSGYLNWTASLSSGDTQHALIQTLNAQWILENLFGWWISGSFTGARHVYGWAPAAGYSGGHADMPIYPHAGGLGIVGIGSDTPGTNTDNPGSGALIFGHELVHDYNIYHTNTSDGCGSNDSNTKFPYASSSIQEVGYNPATGKIYDPALTHDLMSYCPSGGSKQGWISPYTWKTMFNNLAPVLAPAAAPQQNAPLVIQPTTATASLQINATIYNPAYLPSASAKFGPLYKAPAGISFTLPEGQKTYSVELRNVDGAAIKTYFFDVNFKSEYDAHSDEPHDEMPESMKYLPGLNSPPPFSPSPTVEEGVSFILPWESGTVSIALLYGTQLLDEVAVSANTPQVLITSPSGAEDWVAGSTHTLTWSGFDLDANSLVYSVFYSRDGGVNWDLIAKEITDTSLNILTDSLPGSADVRFRVLVTDGVNTSLDETDEVITIPNKQPTPTILNPTSKTAYLPDALVVLQGIAVDLEDGTLPDENLTWSSDIQGGLGIGPSVGLNTLLPGWHTITLTAVDSNGASASSTVYIYIGTQTFLPVVTR